MKPISLLGLALSLLLWVGQVRAAEDAPVVPQTGGGMKELPGTIQKDVGDAVKRDLGMGGGKKDDDAADEHEPDAGGDEDTDDLDEDLGR